MASWSETDFPFGQPVSPATGPTLNTDLLITKNNPAVEFQGTEANAIYDEIREVGGDWFFATNATFTTNWFPVNIGLPAFALRLRANGAMDRVWSAAGTSPITWTLLTQTDPSGAIITTPATFTTNAEIALSMAPTWNASGTIMSAIKLNVTDTASNANSTLLDLKVAGTSAFTVRKDGAVTMASGTFLGSGPYDFPFGIGVDGQSGTTGLLGGNTGVGLYIRSVENSGSNIGMQFDVLTGGSYAWSKNNGATILMALNTNGALVLQPVIAGSSALFLQSLPSASQPTVSLNMGASQSVAGLLVNGAAGITGNLLQIDLTSGGTHGLQFTAGGTLQVGAALNTTVTAGDIVASRNGSSGSYWFGSTSASSGLLFFDGTRYNFFSAGAGVSTANILASSGLYSQTSDEILKENVVPIALGLNEILSLEPVQYDWILDKTQGQGFIAQKLQEVIPNAVSIVDTKSGILGISDSMITPVVVKAIQELTAELRSYISAHP